MELKSEILDKCTLLQACEWIAFGWEPMLPIYERAIGRNRYDLVQPDENRTMNYDHETQLKYNEDINASLSKIELALYQNKIHASGLSDRGDIWETRTQIIRSQVFMEMTGKDEYADKIKECKDYLDASLEKINSKNERCLIVYVLNKVSIDIAKNTIKSGYITYNEVEFLFSELKSLFPDKTKTPALELVKNGYTTPYLEIMREIITEQKITDKNQPLHKILVGEIEKKMAKYGLTKSESLAKSMATLIRLPEAQKGHAHKGKTHYKK